ncbi:MAG: serine--tRNA ligase [Phycisphaeraceae bacterium]
MIDIKDLRENPQKYRDGAAAKKMDASAIDQLLELDATIKPLQQEREHLTAEQNRLSKEIGPLQGRLKKATGDEKVKLEAQLKELLERPAAIKVRIDELAKEIAAIEPKRDELLLFVPQPPDPDVPRGSGPEDNVEIRRWNSPWFDPSKSFEANKGFKAKSHVDLMHALNMVDFERGVKIAGSRSYVLTGDGMRLHQAILRYAFEFMTNDNGFTPMSVPVLVRHEAMEGTGFFPHGKDQAYEVAESSRGGNHDLYLTGTGEVGLMGYHMNEIVDFEKLPLKYTTLSTCFRREAGAAGKDAKGLYRIHQFDKIEQVVICKADEAESRAWHQKMMGFVETLLQRLEIPYRLLQCCTADLGPKNVDMIDIESWMPSRGEELPDGTAGGAYSETHSASRLYDYQCRRLNIRYKDPETKKNVICHALNNTVAASPRILIPIIELYQNADGSITVPAVLRPYMNGQERIG